MIVQATNSIGGPTIYAKGAEKIVKTSSYFRLFIDCIRAKDDLYAMGIMEAIPAYLACLINRTRFSIRIPGNYPWEIERLRGINNTTAHDFRPKTIRTFLLFQWQRFIVRHAYQVIVPSVYCESMVKNWGGKNIVIERNRSRIPIVSGAVASSKDLIVLFVGRDVPWKNEKMLREMTIPGCRFVFLHDAPQDVVSAWYQSADVLVLPSDYEGNPHVVHEAVAHGLRCLISDQGGNPELKEEYPDMVRIITHVLEDGVLKPSPEAWKCEIELLKNI